MSIRQKTVQALAMAGVIAMVLFLAGCGGGGGGSSSNMMTEEPMGMTPTTPDPTTPDPTDDDMGPFMLPATSRMFMRLNAMDITNDDATMQDQMRMAEVGRFVDQMNRATQSTWGGTPSSGGESNVRRRKIASARADWFGDEPDQPGLLTITITPDNTAANVGPNGVDITPLVMNYDADAMNFEMIGGLDDVFMHGFEIWREGDPAEDQAQAIVFTDKQQGTAAIEAVTAVTAKSLVYEPTTLGAASFDLSSVSADGRTITDVTYYENTTLNTTDPGFAYTGTLTCPTGASCTYNTDDLDTTGFINIEGFVFSGTRMAREAVTGVPATDGPNDYIVFGLWLHETAMGTGTDADSLESFGGFAWAGGTHLPRDNGDPTHNEQSGTLSYSGKAFGAHHMDGVISWFDANADLTIDFRMPGNPDPNVVGAGNFDNVISGEISNIRIAGGEPLDDSIYLHAEYGYTGDDNIRRNAIATMGPILDPAGNPLAQQWELNGSWDYDRFGPSASGNPDRIVGTFALNNEDGTEGFVGAFGTRIEE